MIGAGALPLFRLHSSWLYLIKFCASFSRPSSPSTSITDTVSYLISYLPPLYFHAYRRLTCICIGSSVTPDPRTPPRVLRLLRLLPRTRDRILYLYFHTCILWMSQTTFDGRPIRKHESQKNSGDWRFKVDAFLVVQAFCRNDFY
jgi:hypothetical protein